LIGYAIAAAERLRVITSSAATPAAATPADTLMMPPPAATLRLMRDIFFAARYAYA